MHGIGCFAEDKILVSRNFMKEFFALEEKKKEACNPDEVGLDGKPLPENERKKNQRVPTPVPRMKIGRIWQK